MLCYSLDDVIAVLEMLVNAVNFEFSIFHKIYPKCLFVSIFCNLLQLVKTSFTLRVTFFNAKKFLFCNLLYFARTRKSFCYIALCKPQKMASGAIDDFFE